MEVESGHHVVHGLQGVGLVICRVRLGFVVTDHHLLTSRLQHTTGTWDHHSKRELKQGRGDGRKRGRKKEEGWRMELIGRALDRHAADAGSIPRCGKRFFSQSQLSVQTLLRASVHPRVQSHVLTSVRTVKILWSMSEFGGLWKH